MSDYVICASTGDCPYLGRKHTIQVTFAKIAMNKSLSCDYKKMSYECELGNECTCLDEFGACVVFKKAPNPI